MKSEKTIEAYLTRRVKEMGGIALKFSSYYFTGVPDRIVLMPEGKIFFVELKTTGKKPTALQLKVHTHFKHLGFRVYVIDSREGIDNFLKEIA